MEGLKAPKGANKAKRIVGRGYGSGRGRYSGRGMNGQNARSGGGVRPGFEGGQLPLYRRLATRGFSNYPFKKVYQAISLDEISALFSDGDTVTDETLREKGLLKGKKEFAKVLANGECTKKITLDGVKASASAAQKIEAAGGTVVAAKPSSTPSGAPEAQPEAKPEVVAQPEAATETAVASETAE